MAGQSKLAVILCGIGSLTAVYGIYRLLQKLLEKDEFFLSCKWKGGGPQRRILILGLRQTGKSRLLQCFQRYLTVCNSLPPPVPTIGYNIHSVGLCGVDFHFWGGGGIWYDERGVDHFGIPSNIDVLVWVVDSSRTSLFHASRTAFHKFIQTYDDRTIRESKNSTIKHVMYGTPVVIIATKQDIPGSVSASQVLLEMQADSIQKHHKVYIVGTQVPDSGQRRGLWRLYELLAFAERKRYKIND